MNRPSLSSTIVITPDFSEWRSTARRLLASAVRPEDVSILDTASSVSAALFSTPIADGSAIGKPPSRVPAAFIERAQFASCHRSPDRWNLFYRLLWRLQTERHLLQIEVDEDVAALRRLEIQLRRDIHKMHAFVRFQKVADEEQEQFIAWYEPDHFILREAAPFFVDRFAVMRWSILTPDGSVAWDSINKQLSFGPGVPRSAAPSGDQLDSLWRTYYRSIFNPARTNLHAMRAEMPIRYWKNLPEIDALPGMLSEADRRVDTMIKQQSKQTAESFVPQQHTLSVLYEALPGCKGCDLYKCATQAVFGCGPAKACLMLIGEQPGDEEDRRGEPFAGPAGRLLDTLLEEAGVVRSDVYVTNAVKHFKFKEQGKRRLHENPRLSEIFACRPWVLAEIDAVQPKAVVCLGASASKSLLGGSFALMRERGKVLSSPYARQVVATIHPSAVLRAIDRDRAAEIRSMLISDLRLAARLVA